jgi:hypothetical protein
VATHCAYTLRQFACRHGGSIHTLANPDSRGLSNNAHAGQAELPKVCREEIHPVLPWTYSPVKSSWKLTFHSLLECEGEQSTVDLQASFEIIGNDASGIGRPAFRIWGEPANESIERVDTQTRPFGGSARSSFLVAIRCSRKSSWVVLPWEIDPLVSMRMPS